MSCLTFVGMAGAGVFVKRKKLTLYKLAHEKEKKTMEKVREK